MTIEKKLFCISIKNIQNFCLKFCYFYGHFKLFSLCPHFFISILKKRRRNRKERGVKWNSVRNWCNFDGNCIILMGNSHLIWPFQNLPNSRTCLGIPKIFARTLNISNFNPDECLVDKKTRKHDETRVPD